MSALGGWQEFAKRTGGSAYEKHDNALAVIIAKSKKPAQIYLSKLALHKLGDPAYIVVHVNGTEIGFAPDDGTNSYAYKLARSENTKEGRLFLSCRSVIAQMNLRSGVYNAYLHEAPPNKMIVINAHDLPSQI